MSWLDRELTTLAFVWRLERRDGIVLGLTSHDQPLWFDGLLCRSAPGLSPSAIERTETMDALTVELSGGLSSEALSAADLAGGRWDGARLSLYAVDWTEPERDPHLLVLGALGNVHTTQNSFSAELKEESDWLDLPCAPTLSPECRADLGDSRCRVDMARRTAMAVISASDGTTLYLAEPVAASERFAFGELIWVDGANTGLRQVIVQAQENQISVREAPTFSVAAGDRVLLVEGCDGRLATCRERFANVVNFRGEPHVPGTDLLVRYAR